MIKNIIIAGSLLTFLGCKNPVDEPVEKIAPSPNENYSLVWNDEFSGTQLDLTKWNFETGTGVNGDFGTGQIDRATERKENISIISGVTDADGGCLAVVTRSEHYIDREFTSGRITTSGKGAWGPGHRIEARIWAKDIRYKGQGFAMWMMPAEKPAGVSSIMWPQGGEIDIMEYVGTFPYDNLGSVHYAWSWLNNEYADWNHGHKGGYYSYAQKELPVSAPSYTGLVPSAGDDASGSGTFHLYGIEWFADRMEFFVDGDVYHVNYFNDGGTDNGFKDGQDKDVVRTVNGKRRLLSEYSHHLAEWKPFEHSFFLILSAGVGGSDSRTYGGAVVPSAVFPCSVYVDWVRVYKKN
ncbi:MAG: glycoside hydrolase family 16 protein [Bacteroidetes bacterium]|nr:glycoside hydrolase family 16 protein [Bacteroidota bacterium]